MADAKVNWADLKERVLRSVITSVTAAVSTIHFTIDGLSITDLETWGKAILVAAVVGALTGLKSGIGVGIGSNPQDGSLK